MISSYSHPWTDDGTVDWKTPLPERERCVCVCVRTCVRVCVCGFYFLCPVGNNFRCLLQFRGTRHVVTVFTFSNEDQPLWDTSPDPEFFIHHVPSPSVLSLPPFTLRRSLIGIKVGTNPEGMVDLVEEKEIYSLRQGWNKLLGIVGRSSREHSLWLTGVREK